MDFLSVFIHVYLMYCRELWLPLAVGFILSGLFFEFISSDIVERHLGDPGLRPVFISSLAGVILPVCCIGALPLALTLRRKGASLGSVLAFLVATPATSVSALIVTWRLLGFEFTLVIFSAVIIIAFSLGILTNHLKFPNAVISENASKVTSCCCQAPFEISSAESSVSCCTPEPGPPNVWRRLTASFQYAFWTLPKQIGLEIVIGIAVASFITVYEPIQHLIRQYLTGAMGYVFILISGLLTYVCSTASVPLADALIHSGMSQGQALCYLLVGPITSYGTILVIRKDFGWQVLWTYLMVISVLSVFFGVVYDVFFI